MKKAILTAIMIFASACGVNVVQVQSQSAASTGWHNENGQIVTTEHGHNGGTATAVSVSGYESGEIEPQTRIAEDVVAYGPTSYRKAQCYTDAEAGDLVTVSTLRGPIRTSVVEVGYRTVVLRRKLRHGDSGSPVTKRGCVIGVAHSVSSDGTTVIRIREPRGENCAAGVVLISNNGARRMHNAGVAKLSKVFATGLDCDGSPASGPGGSQAYILNDVGYFKVLHQQLISRENHRIKVNPIR
jgi:hypothetical protein